MAGTTSVKDLLDNRKKESNLTVTVNSYSYSNSSSSSLISARKFVETLDPRVASDRRWFPFYTKAVLKLGSQRVLIAQSMALDPTVKSAERMFSWLLKQELDALGGDIAKASA